MFDFVLVAALLRSQFVAAAHLRTAPDGDPMMGMGMSSSATARPVAWLHFVSFGDEKYRGATARIHDQAWKTGLFLPQNIHVFHKVPDKIWFDPKWEWHRKVPRGHGYWFWKSAITKYLFETILGFDDVILYADAGCEFGFSEKALALWTPLLQKSQANDLVAFSLTYDQAMWTKGDIFAAFNVSVTDKQYADTAIIVGGYWLMRNTPASRDFLTKWEDLIARPELVNDDKSVVPNSKDFKQNRHDEALFSMLIKANEPTAPRCQSVASRPGPAFTVGGVRNLRWSSADMKIELLPDMGWPTSPCNPISAKRNAEKASYMKVECPKLPDYLSCWAEE